MLLLPTIKKNRLLKRMSFYFGTKCNYFLKAPDAVPRGLRGWGSKKDNMEITWEVRCVQGKTLHLVKIIQ